MPVADRRLSVRRQRLNLQTPASKTLRDDADSKKREQDDREGIVLNGLNPTSSIWGRLSGTAKKRRERYPSHQYHLLTRRVIAELFGPLPVSDFR